MRNYIGLASTYHDPAIAIVNSAGEVVFAEAAERYLQNKRAIGVAADDLVRVKDLMKRYCEPGAEIVYARTWNLDWSPQTYMGFDAMGKAFADVGRGRKELVPDPIKPAFAFLGIDLDEPESLGSRYVVHYMRWNFDLFTADRHAGANLRYQVREKTPDWRGEPVARAYDHHLTHAVTGCFTSPFEDAVCAVIDGSGSDMQTNSFFRYEGGRITRIEVPSQREAYGSLGLFYHALCEACRFDPTTGEEWKVMGLAPYGKLDPELYAIMKPMFEHSHLALRPAKDFMARLTAIFDRRRPKGSHPREAADLAFTGQKVFGEWSKMLLSDLYELGISKNLVLIGGCALNSSWNGRILEETKFEKLHVYAAPGDDGNALGAALLAYQDDNPPERAPAKAMTPYLGDSLSKEALEFVTKFGGMKNALPPGKSVAKFTAELLAQGKIVGWAQGRAEFGPRALGNRSILADPRDPAMKDKINGRVKFREEYRPFAPSILHEHGPAYFEAYAETPYMERTLRFREEVKSKVPAVVHEDGTGRLQSVKAEWNPRYHELISEFYALTGVPIVLNTSFNVMGKPIVHSVEDALAVFFTSGLDVLVMEDLVFVKDA